MRVFAGIILYLGTAQYIGTVLYLVGTVRDVSIAFYVVLFIAAVLAMRKRGLVPWEALSIDSIFNFIFGECNF